MTSKTLSELFLAHWQAENPEGRIYRNNTGVAFYPTESGSLRPVAYGIPAPKVGKTRKDKPKGGGGTDYIGFKPHHVMFFDRKRIKGLEDGVLIVAEFYEIKTLNDVISDAQKRFYKVINKMGGTINIVKELPNDKWEIVEWME